MEVEGDDEQTREWLTTIEANVPHPEVLGLINSTEPFAPEEVMEKALAYKPIQL